MKHHFVIVPFLCMSAICTMGCAEKKSTKSELKITTPGGETTITTEREVELSGESPPPTQQ